MRFFFVPKIVRKLQSNKDFFGGYSVSIVRIWYSLSVSLTFWVMILKKKVSKKSD